jgi:transcriptional/translational regulatory protein YebC/TACO1
MVSVSDADGEKLSALIEIIEDHDDVQDVYTNAE